jgi:hypothetical protein
VYEPWEGCESQARFIEIEGRKDVDRRNSVDGNGFVSLMPDDTLVMEVSSKWSVLSRPLGFHHDIWNVYRPGFSMRDLGYDEVSLHRRSLAAV